MLTPVSKTCALRDLAIESMNKKKSKFVKKIHTFQQIKCFFESVQEARFAKTSDQNKSRQKIKMTDFTKKTTMSGRSTSYRQSKNDGRT